MDIKKVSGVRFQVSGAGGNKVKAEYIFVTIPRSGFKLIFLSVAISGVINCLACFSP